MVICICLIYHGSNALSIPPPRPARLAESRTNPQVLDIGVMSEDLHADTLQLSPSAWDGSDGNDLFGF